MWFICLLTWIWFKLSPLETLYNWLVDLSSSAVYPDYRQQFKDNCALLWIKHGAPRNHSHPEAARSRCRANIMMSNFITSLGMDRFSYSMSATEKRLAMAGNRYYYEAKDLQMHAQFGSPQPGQVVTLTDVDYYADMNALLSMGLPTLLYTFVPTSVAGSTENGVYKVNDQNHVEMLVDGGARYEHPLWDYDTDHLIVHSYWYSYMYLVEQLRVTDDRRIVFLNPIRRVSAPMAWLLKGKTLTRRKLVSNGAVAGQYLERQEGGMSRAIFSFARVNSYDALDLPSYVLQASLIRAKESKTPHISDIERIFNTYMIPNPVFAAALFIDLYKNTPEIFNVKMVNVSPCVEQHTYQAVGPLVTEDGTPSMRALWPGYSRDTFSPAKSYNNDVACIEGRIKEPRNREPQLPPITQQYLEEFLAFLVPQHLRGTLSPLDYDEMEEQFDRPTQRSLLERAKDFMFGKNVIRSFQKAEAYPKITHPRNITTCSMSHNFIMGQFGVPFVKRIMKGCHWYAFGKHPSEIARRLEDKARGARYSVNTDANKLDGSVYFFFRDLVVAAVKRAYHPQYHAEIQRAELKERNLRGKTAHGVSYDAKCTVLSGSSWTSIFGTLTNGFINYVALRNYHDAESAWKAMGVYGGDDGITFDLPPNAVKKTAAIFGMAFDAEAVPINEPVKYLGRIYPDLSLNGDSICDVARQARKLHLTATSELVPTHVALYRKAQGYRVTDEDTPFITPWCDAVIRLCKPLNPEGHRMYASTKDEAVYWSKFETPFNTPTDKEFKYSIVSKELGLTTGEIERYEDIFRKATKLEDLFLVDILKLKTTVNIDAVVAGTIRHAMPRKTIPEIVDEHIRLETKFCRFVENGKDCRRANCPYEHNLPANHKHAPGNRRSPQGSGGAGAKQRAPPRNSACNGENRTETPKKATPQSTPVKQVQHNDELMQRGLGVTTTTNTVKPVPVSKSKIPIPIPKAPTTISPVKPKGPGIS